MTESEWLAATDPAPMLAFLNGKASDRKLRMFAVACCRQFPYRMAEEAIRTAVNTAERFADGQASPLELAHARIVILSTKKWSIFVSTVYDDAFAAAWYTQINAAHFRRRRAGTRATESFAALLQDIFGNPFRPVAPDPSWLTSPVLSLAGRMYETRDFSPMPILADALQEAGCDNPDVLDHCRGDGPHVRGCWVVDMLMGRS